MGFPEFGVEGLGLLWGDAGGSEAAGEEFGGGESEELRAGFGRGEGVGGDGG